MIEKIEDLIEKKETKKYRGIMLENSLWNGCKEVADKLKLATGKDYSRSEVVRIAIKKLLKKAEIL